MRVNSHPHRSTEGRGMDARGDSSTNETWMLWDQKPEKKRVLRTESQLFTQDVSSLACFFISLAAYAGSEALQAVLFSSYLVHKTTAVVPGVPSGDRGNWE